MRSIDLPLHSGHCPAWLFSRMKKLSSLIAEAIVNERGTKAFLERLSDPLWFQAFSCAIGFDWHSSGTTTVTLGALKEGLRERDVGIGIYGGKGKAMSEIRNLDDGLREKARLAYRADWVALQDGYSIYHHAVVTDGKNWAVVQQGMKEKYARRYHWFNARDFFNDTRYGLIAMKEEKDVIDLTSSTSSETRKTVIDMVNDEGSRLSRYSGSLWAFVGKENQTRNGMPKRLRMPRDIDWQSLNRLKENQLASFEELVSVGDAKTIRALALIAHLIYGTEISWKDPVHYSYAFGGKDGVPYPVDRKRYDKAIKYLRDVVDGLDVSKKERLKALQRLDIFVKW